MRTAGVAFLISILTAAVLTPFVRRLALRHGLLDHAIGSRKIHGKPVPRIGGVAIIGAFMVPLLALAVFETSAGQLFYENKVRALALMIGGLIIGVLGIYDDLKGANAAKKFAVQTVLAVGLYYAGFQINQLATPFGTPLPLGYFGLPFTVFWIVGVINALNLIDGLDGLAGGVAFFAVGTTFIIAFLRGDALMVLFMACLGGAVLGFLFYNFNPASIFMGDTGSMFLGLILAVSSIQTSQKSSTAVAILVPIIVLGLPIADTLLAMTRRAIRGRPIFSADREHIHHRLMGLGLSHRKAVLTLYATCVLLAATALLLTFANSVQAAILLAFLVLSFIAGMRILGFLRLSPGNQANLQRQRNRQLRGTVREVGARLAVVSSGEGIWDAIRGIRELVAARSMALDLSKATSKGDRSTERFSIGEDPAGMISQFHIHGEPDAEGELTFSWNDGRTEIDRDDEIAIEVLCDHVAGAWSRICFPERGRKNSGRGTITALRR